MAKHPNSIERARPLRVVVIGAGPATVNMHLPVLARLRDLRQAELAIICDLDRDRALAAQRVFGFSEESGDGRAVLARQDIDAVYVFGSAQMHYELGMAALRSGKHLFVEKPLAPSYLQAREMAEVAQMQGRIAVVGHNRRYYKSLTQIRERAGKVRCRFGEAVFHKPQFATDPPYGARTWLTANGIHALDALIFMMQGLPQELRAQSGDRGARHRSVFSAIMSWSDGAQAAFLCNNNSGSRREEYAFHVSGETYSVSEEGLKIEKGDTLTRVALPSLGDGIAAEHDAFLQAIRGTAEPLHSIAHVSPSLFLAELIEEGFCGCVELPEDKPSKTVSRFTPPTDSILVVNASESQRVLSFQLPKCPLISLEDVQKCAGKRFDVTAAILGRGASALPKDVLDKLPRLGLVGVAGLSLARQNPEELLARGIQLINASAAYADTVAEFALGLAILGRRRAFVSHEVMRRGGWGANHPLPGLIGYVERSIRRARPALAMLEIESAFAGIWRRSKLGRAAGRERSRESRDLRDATVGLIGWGANAQALTRLLLLMQARVFVYSEHSPGDAIRESGATPTSLDEALSSDVVSLHRGLTDKTRHFLGAAELSRLRPGAVLINIARGALIEPDALLARLTQGDVFACLDSFDAEPLDARSALRRLPNVFLTSHIAGGTRDMHAAAAAEIVGKVAAYLSGDNLPSISAERLRTMT
ncbi:MAG TPA: NAD(P)-dependent oxidoreductase [Steroidobacteraceae bacterium]|jgi:phosphoglycerate dehydrogenase-like enzyme/predicted dehydrogenase|nr:NAD(P)-dependent oxidoreductase [Steroidobacteraceae bacterium]